VISDPNSGDLSHSTPGALQRVAPYMAASLDAAPAVTVVTPFYNTGEIFEETARSVLGQTLQQFEWLIINDASTDGASLALLDHYRSSDPRVRVIDHTENRGLSASRNTGFSAARAELVMQLDADDLLEPTCLEKLSWFMTSHPEFSFAKGYTTAFGSESYLWVNGFHMGSAFLSANHADSNSMVRRSVHQAVGGYDETNRGGLEDWDFWLKCANQGFWGGTVHQPLTRYRKKSSHTVDWPNWDGGEREAAFLAGMRERYARLWEPDGFPDVGIERYQPYQPIPTSIPFHNRLVKETRRVMLLLPWLTVGGADRFNLEAISQLQARGWGVTILTTGSGDNLWEAEFARLTDDVHVMHRFLRPVDFPRFVDYAMGSRQPDVVLLSNSELGYQILPYLRSRRPEVTFVDFVHAEQPAQKSGGYANFSNLYREQLDLTATASRHLAGWMVERGSEQERVEVCYLGVDPDQWKPMEDVRVAEREGLGVDPDTPVIVYAARLAEEKQPKVFAETMRILADRGMSFLAVVAGDGPDREWLREFVAQHRLVGQVRLLGSVSSERMQRLLRAADIFFLPSQWEGIALSIYEAMATGLPVVAARVGGQAELVTADTGILVDRTSVATEAAAYSEALSDLLTSAKKRQEMGKAGRKRIEDHFTVDEMGTRLEVILEHAREMQRLSPRPSVPEGAASAHATLAIEYSRVEEIVSYLWSRDAQEQTSTAGRARGWKWRVYRGASVILGPFYRMLKDSENRWIIRVKNRVRALLGVHPTDLPWDLMDQGAAAEKSQKEHRP
jgi:glycosyltransferase involved in cell wall biosynthesis/GT2 family glycosyltransferase